MPGARSGVSDHEFLYLAIKLSPQVNTNFDFQKVGDAIGITKHSAYCRWLSIKEKLETEAKSDGLMPDTSATETTKRKRGRPKNEQKLSSDDGSDDGESKKMSKKNKTGSKKGKKEAGEQSLGLLRAGGFDEIV